MASQQLSRRENTTTERRVHLDKDTVPNMATHFENLAGKTNKSGIDENRKEPPQALQGGNQVKERAGKATGDVGGRRKVKGEDPKEKVSDHAANVVGNEEREGYGGVRDVGKFEMKTEGGDGRKKDREELETRTREVKGRTQRRRENEGQVVAEKGRGVKLGASATTANASTLEKCDSNSRRLREESESEKSTLEQVSNSRDHDSIDLKKRCERAKQAASETLNSAAQIATQAKDATVEKGQQGCAVTKDTISSAANTVSEKTAPVAEKAKGYTFQVTEKAKSAGGTTARYVGEKAAQAKDVAVEGGKSAAGYAAKVAADLKDRAPVVGWAAAHFSTEMTVEGTKVAAHVVEGAAGYAGQKAAELASKSVGAVKVLAASAGESAKGYTARKKEEAQRELKAKRASQLAEERQSEGMGETVIQNAEKPKEGGGSSQQEGTGSDVLTEIGETESNVGAKVKKPFDGGTKEESGSETSGGQEEGKDVSGQTLKSTDEKLGDAAQRGAARTLLR
ncbi:seed biotin-containing protein SBP65-like [Vigna umbellata]|uniref:seed biotin-containing protein SBP65-like n=1 Tax=Vigna umbellata TaxID=87088 RepID=UPI001F5FE32A|nr:seed biotin-containing protein SBP65-like [Vigna umbellata]